MRLKCIDDCIKRVFGFIECLDTLLDNMLIV